VTETPNSTSTPKTPSDPEDGGGMGPPDPAATSESHPSDPAAYYDDYGEREWERLERDLYHRLEFEETTHFLERELPEPVTSSTSVAVPDATASG
jgi:hypothetical protein